MARPVTKYGFINAKLRARISKGLDSEHFRRMIEASDINEAVQVLGNTAYSEVPHVYHDTGDIKMVERVILSHEIDAVRELKRYAEGEVETLIDRLLEQYEMEILKDAIRFWFDRMVRIRDIEDGYSYLYKEPIVHNIDVYTIVYADSEEEIYEALENTPYFDVISEELPRAKEGGSLYTLETKLEHLYFNRLREAAEEFSGRDREIAERILGTQIDIENISRISRYIRFYRDAGKQGELSFIPGGGNLSGKELEAVLDAAEPMEALLSRLGTGFGDKQAFEQLKGKREDTSVRMLLTLVEEILEEEIRKLLYGYPFTVGIVLAYCFIKKNEIQKVIRVLNGKYYGTEQSRLNQLL
jgi:V/A-type H+-transporting ATPase subunit C